MNSESGKTINPKTMRGPFCESADVPDTAYDDGKLANRAIRDLKRMKEAGKPFFLACWFLETSFAVQCPKENIGIYINGRKYLWLPIVSDLKDCRSRFVIRARYMRMHGLRIRVILTSSGR